MKQYKNIGGNIAPAVLPGVDAHRQLRARQDTGTPFVPTTGEYEKDIDSFIKYAGDPRNVPDYYSGSTVAQPGADTNLSREGLRGAADQYDALTGDLLGDYQAQLDPNSAINQQLGQAASVAGNLAGYNSGVLGGLRSQQATQGAARQAIQQNRQNALDKISGLRGDLRGGSDILGEVGRELDSEQQDIINEDIKRFNYAQLSPQQQIDRVLSLLTAKEGLKQGRFQAPTQDRSGGIFSNLAGDFARKAGGSILDSVFGGFGFNQGGEIPGEAPVGDPMMGPGEGVDPMMDANMPQDPMAAGGDPMMSDPMSQDPMMGDPLAADPMTNDMMAEPQSEIDQVASAVEQLIASTGAPLTITRKTVKAKAVKK